MPICQSGFVPTQRVICRLQESTGTRCKFRVDAARVLKKKKRKEKSFALQEAASDSK